MVTITIAIFGRFFCGWMCPVGTLLHYFHLFTNKGEKKRVGGRWRNREKYVILLAVLAAGLVFELTATYLFSPPRIVYSALVHLTVLGIIGADILVLVVILVLDILAMRYGRTWCDTLCPLGGMISGLSVINIFKPSIDHETCIDFDFNCLHCERVCPMRIPITRADRWTMMECNKCMRCWTSCPVNAVKIDILGGK
jgi:polyferredoxin